MMPREDILNHLQEIARRVSKMNAVDNTEIALVNLMAGALYALHRTAKLDFDDSRVNPNPETSKHEFRHTASNISNGLTPADGWLAGFYLNSALLRMALINERFNAHTRTQYDMTNLRRLVNKIKHQPDAQIGQPWQFTLVDAVDALEILCSRLEDSLTIERD